MTIMRTLAKKAMTVGMARAFAREASRLLGYAWVVSKKDSVGGLNYFVVVGNDPDDGQDGSEWPDFVACDARFMLGTEVEAMKPMPTFYLEED